MVKILKNTKWLLMFYFLLSGVVMAAIIYMGVYMGYIEVKDNVMWLYYSLGIFIFTVVIGYMAGQRIQRGIDVLDLNMLQVAKGNLSVRMPIAEDQSFARVYHEFN